MTIHDLNHDQLETLRQRILIDRNAAAGEGTIFGELAETDTLIGDEELFAEFGGVEFVEDDF